MRKSIVIKREVNGSMLGGETQSLLAGEIRLSENTLSQFRKALSERGEALTKLITDTNARNFE